MFYNPYANLAESFEKRLKRLDNKKISPNWIITPELAKTIWAISYECGRQIALIIDRLGVVQYVIAGDSNNIIIPKLSRFALLPRRLRGLRLIRTELSNKIAPDKNDIYSLGSLRLDAVSVLTGNETAITSLTTAHQLPPSPTATGELIQHAIMENTSPHKMPLEFNFFIKGLEDEIATKTKTLYETDTKNSAILVGAFMRRDGSGEAMTELAELAKTAEIDVLGMITQINNINPKTVMGGGKLQEVILSALAKGADTIIFNNDLTPSQMKAITDITELTVLDRTALILEIFARRAVTNEGKIRVELAKLRHYLPYLAGSYDNLSRISGTGGGGASVKGSGETKLEIDRRRISERITMLSKKLKKIEQNRATQRVLRERNEIPVIAIVGYTNAGKSTLLNALTQSENYADNKLFATLDTSSKRMRFPEDKDVIIIDTVGFIRDLPENLAGSFKSTLEEIYNADILLHVVDGASFYAGEHIQAVRTVLRELEMTDIPTLIVYNKADIIPIEKRELLRADEPDALFISALDKRSLPIIINRVNTMLA